MCEVKGRMRISGVSLSGKRVDAHEGEFLIGTEIADVVGERG